MHRKVILNISCTLDGYISKPNDDLSFLNRVQMEGEDYGYAEFTSSVDTVIVGRKTYEWVVNQGYEYPHNDKQVYIISRKEKSGSSNTHYYSGDLRELVKKLKEQDGKNIYCDGGASIANTLINLGLIDEMIISVVPVIVGSGTKLFADNTEYDLELISVDKYKSGLVQLHYKFIR